MSTTLACAIADEIRPLGIEVRAGLHTGECEVIGDDISGIAVHIGARVAALARRGNEMVLESPRAGALFQIGDPGIGATLAALSRPQKISRLRRHAASFNLVLLELLLDSQILLNLNAQDGDGLRVNEGDGNLVLWDFHDLVFHTRSTEGRQSNPLGGAFTYADVVAPLPAVRPPWPGKKIDLCKFSASDPISPFAKLLRERHSIRDFDDQHPVTFAELAQFLDTAARVLSEWKSGANFEGVPEITYSTRPYPSAGSAYELELYLAVSNCEGLARGLYHYDAGGHALVRSGSPHGNYSDQLGEPPLALDQRQRTST